MIKPKRIRLFLIIITLLLAITGCVRNPQAKPLKPKTSSIFKKGDIEKVQVIKESAYIRGGNSIDYPVVTTVKKDESLDTAGQVGKWYIIVLDDGRVGAISPHDVKPITDKAEKSVITTNIEDLNPNEKELLRLLNGERAKIGLSPLKVNLEATEIARYKSQDMIDNDYFSHYSPTYGSPFEMLRTFNIKYIYAGENIAGNTSVKEAHESLMDSEGHKENILNPEFTHVGIGVKEGSKYGKIFTQIFITK